jgi:predicted transcriptional regulator
MQEYLTFMFEKGLIDIKEAKEAKKRKKIFFVSTDKGRRLLNLYEQINEMISITTTTTK